MTDELNRADLERAAAPVQKQPAASPRDRAPRAPREGVALCLSGGGYRAMLFHLGALWRLNETGYLHRLGRVSSVSGGSITAGVLALNWEKLAFDQAGVAAAFGEQVVEPVRAMAGRTIDWQAILLGTLLPGSAGGRWPGPTASTSSVAPTCNRSRHARSSSSTRRTSSPGALAFLETLPVGLPRG